LLKELTSTQLAEWEAYDKIDPIGEWRSDFRISYLTWIVTNLAIQIHGKKGAEQTKIDDFILKWDAGEKEEKVQTVEDMRNVLLGIAARQNKSQNKVKRPPPKSLEK